jgi:uncharacterized protein
MPYLTPLLLLASPALQQPPVITPVSFTRVRFTDGLWAERLRTHRRVTLPYVLDQCSRTGRIANFEVAGGLAEGTFRGRFYDDSDVYKAIEGACYTLAAEADPVLRARVDGIVVAIAAAQEEDGYLYIFRTILGEDHGNPGAGPRRWSNLASSHELYNVGHLYEAAVAHHAATGETTLLDVARRSADLLCRVFGPGEDQLQQPPGHQEIELALVKLSAATGEQRYLELARFFLELRGRHEGLYGPYSQDHLPVAEQTEAVGHAVRAGYQYAAMADLAALGAPYGPALDALWDDVVGRKTYLTAGVGATRHGEAFGAAFELPNATAYAETCAAVAQILWAERMFRLRGDGRYFDVLERALYNGFLAGLSLSGDRFFYPNPLACDGSHGSGVRSPWFDCSCCPVNVVRVLPSLPGMVYATAPGALYVNLYGASEARLEVDGAPLGLRQVTDYPWNGVVRLELTLEEPRDFELRLRIPGWAREDPMPGGPYRYLTPSEYAPALVVNGERVPLELERGYAHLDRTWRGGDTVLLLLPTTVRRVLADERIEADRGRSALERGPLLYALEGKDCGGSVDDLVLPDLSEFEVKDPGEPFGDAPCLEGKALRVSAVEGKRKVEPVQVRAWPYFLWANRGSDSMAVWLPRTPGAVQLPPPPPFAAIATAGASHCWRDDTTAALNDGRDPRNSADEALPRHTWWPHTGTGEWLSYDFDQPTRLHAIEVYWFDDTGTGGCRVPRAARLLHRVEGEWRPVPGAGPVGCERDRFNRVEFEALEVSALRLEVELDESFSGGVLEWRVE